MTTLLLLVKPKSNTVHQFSCAGCEIMCTAAITDHIDQLSQIAKHHFVVVHDPCMVFAPSIALHNRLCMSCAGTSFSIGASLPVRRGKRGPDPKPPAPPPSMAPPPKSSPQTVPLPAGAEAQAPLPGRITPRCYKTKKTRRGKTTNQLIVVLCSCPQLYRLQTDCIGCRHNHKSDIRHRPQAW